MGVYVKAVGLLLAFVNSVAQQLQQHHDELNGVTAQREATSEANIQELEAVGRPVASAERDKLWDANSSRFGTDGK